VGVVILGILPMVQGHCILHIDKNERKLFGDEVFQVERNGILNVSYSGINETKVKNTL